jgi:hypothetical protein
LARKAPDDRIDGNSIGSKPLGGEGSHVIVNRHSRPVLGENSLSLLVLLAERNGFEPARPLQTKVEAANACE